MPILAYLVALIVFVAMDAIWLGLMGSTYRLEMGTLLAPEVRWGPAAAFYLLQLLGIMIFVIWPGRQRSALWVVPHGALFGLFTYGTYDLTNYAVLQHWSLELTVTDMVWGMVVSATAGTIGWLVLRGRGGARRRR
jgi:uncharacterized membrane protein